MTITSPVANSTVGSPVHVTATASSTSTITKMQLWVDQVAGYSVNASQLDTYVTLAAGSHRFVVLAYDSKGASFSSGATYATVGTAPAPVVAVSISPTSASLQTGATQQFSASVSGTTNTAVTWRVNGVQGGNATTGTITSTGLYTAPSSVPSGGSVTISALSSADTTKSASATVSITAPPSTIGATTVKIVSPAANSTVSSPLAFSAVGGSSIVKMQLWLDSAANATVNSNQLNTSLTLTAGSHRFNVIGYDSAGNSYAAGAINATVSDSSTTSPIVTISPASATLQTGVTQQFTASVSGTTNTGVTWLVNGVQGGSSTTGTISTSGLYTAPATAPSSAVTVTARSVADTTKSASATVTIAAAPAKVSIAISPTNASVTAGQTKQFSATVTGTTNTGVVWFVNGVQGGSAGSGTISASGLYTAPASVPSGAVTVTAKSAYDATVTASATVTITASSSTNPPPPPSGQQYYVSTTGSDSNSGSASSPWKTLTHAASSVKAGATVHVAAGTYNSSSEMKLTAAGTSSARVVFVSDQQWGAKIVSSVSGNSTAVWITGDYVDFVGFDITGPGVMGIYITGSNDRIIGNHVHNMATSGCQAGGGILNGNYSGGHDVDIIGNVVHDIGDYTKPCSTLHGIYTANPGGKIWNNISYRNQGWGIHTWHAASQNNISNNTVIDNGYGGIIVGAGDGSWVNTGTVVTNNIVYNNGKMSGASGNGIEEYGNTGTNTFTNNLVYGNGPKDWSLQNGDTASGSIASNPMFTTYTAYSTTNDYHVQSSSPAINKGTTTYSPAYDMSGATRCATPTLGVYEFGTTSAAWPYMY